MTVFFSFAGRPHADGKVIEVSILAGSNPDPKTGNMNPTGQVFMQPHEWLAFRRLLAMGANNAHLGVGVEVMDGTKRAPKGSNVVDFSRNWNG